MDTSSSKSNNVDDYHNDNDEYLSSLDIIDQMISLISNSIQQISNDESSIDFVSSSSTPPSSTPVPSSSSTTAATSTSSTASTGSLSSPSNSLLPANNNSNSSFGSSPYIQSTPLLNSSSSWSLLSPNTGPNTPSLTASGGNPITSSSSSLSSSIVPPLSLPPSNGNQSSSTTTMARNEASPGILVRENSNPSIVPPPEASAVVHRVFADLDARFKEGNYVNRIKNEAKDFSNDMTEKTAKIQQLCFARIGGSEQDLAHIDIPFDSENLQLREDYSDALEQAIISHLFLDGKDQVARILKEEINSQAVSQKKMKIDHPSSSSVNDHDDNSMQIDHDHNINNNNNNSNINNSSNGNGSRAADIESTASKYVQLSKILTKMDETRDVTEVLQWAINYKNSLDLDHASELRQVLDLIFDIHKLRFYQIASGRLTLNGNGIHGSGSGNGDIESAKKQAIEYGQMYFRPYANTRAAEIQRIVGSMFFPSSSSASSSFSSFSVASSYPSTANTSLQGVSVRSTHKEEEVLFKRVRKGFVNIYCNANKISKDSPLARVVHAGKVLLPKVLQHFEMSEATEVTVGLGSSTNGTFGTSHLSSLFSQMHELPFEIDGETLNKIIGLDDDDDEDLYDETDDKSFTNGSDAEKGKSNGSKGNGSASKSPSPASTRQIKGRKVHHSVFVCPVSREQTMNDQEDNKPVLLTCGHVMSKSSMLQVSKNRTRFKCFTCPTDMTVNDVIELNF